MHGRQVILVSTQRGQQGRERSNDRLRKHAEDRFTFAEGDMPYQRLGIDPATLSPSKHPCIPGHARKRDVAFAGNKYYGRQQGRQTYLGWQLARVPVFSGRAFYPLAIAAMMCTSARKQLLLCSPVLPSLVRYRT